MAQPRQAQPGWYTDPQDATRIRYWDGSAWTEHNLAAPTPAPGTSNGFGSPHVQVTRGKRPWWRRWWAVTAGVLIVLMMIGALASPDDSAEADHARPKTPAPTSAAPTPAAVETTPTPTHTPAPRTRVPALTHISLADARQELRAAHLSVMSVERRPSPLPAGTVLSQSLRTGKSVRYHAGIALVVASPFPHVPSVVSKLRLAAAAALREAGFTVRVTSRTVTSGTENAVLSQTPVGGQSLRPHGLVTIVVAHVVRPVVAPPTSAPPAPSNCTPGYSPCLPPAYDYDCAGGSGDGPKYVYGVETVTGSDPYGLDSDGDGYGCE